MCRVVPHLRRDRTNVPTGLRKKKESGNKVGNRLWLLREGV
jgi:hypothetical protein